MRILIICTFFPPDSSIGGVRPFMFAKYLSKAGHDVTVLRSGELECVPDHTLGDQAESFQVISYLGEDSQAERYKRGQSFNALELQKARQLNWMPESLRDVCKTILKPITGMTRIKRARTKIPYAIREIDKLKEEDSFDCIFATYGNLENIWAGMYASETLKAKFIMDFRDSVVWHHDKWEILWNIYAKHIQGKVLKKADIVTCISDGLKKQLEAAGTTAKIVTVSNGYEESHVYQSYHPKIMSEKLTFSLVGKVYEKGDEHALEILAEALARLVREGSIDSNKISFVYAGRQEPNVRRIFKNFNLENILDCRGYVAKETAYRIQMESDLFVVLSWNTKESQGIIGGKFYEGIRAEKPMLVVVSGEEPNSELRLMNDQYHYGCCYEESMTDREYQDFLESLKQYYNTKMETGSIPYTPNQELATKFRYENLTKEIEDIMISLAEKKESIEQKMP